MERKLIKSKIKIIDFLSKSNKDIFTKLIYNHFENKGKYINKIIYALKHSDNIKFYLAEEGLPKIILDEIKWLKYYNYDIKFIVSNEQIKKNYKSYSNDITVDSNISSNVIEIIDDSKTLYLFYKSNISELISIEQILKNSSDKNDSPIIFMNNKKSLEDKKEAESFKMFNDIINLQNYLKQNQNAKAAYIKTKKLNIENDYLGFGPKLFKKVNFLNQSYYQLMNDENEVYVNLEQDSEQKYTILDNAIVKLNKDEIKTINSFYKTNNFHDFEIANVNVDIDKEIAKYRDYEKFTINCKIEPPCIKPEDGYFISSRYDSVKNILINLKNAILKNMNIDSEMMDNKRLKNLVQSIKLFLVGKNDISLDIRELQELSMEFGDSTQFKEVLRECFDSFMKKSRQNFNTGITKIDKEIENLKSKLSTNIESDSKEYKRLTEELLHLSSIKNDYNTKYKLSNPDAIDFNKLIEIKSISDMSSNKSLSRIVNIKDDIVSKDSIQHRLLKTIASFLMISQFVSSAINEIGKLDIPNVGVLYENMSELGLVIKYEDEIVEAKKIAEKNNYKLFVERENLL